MCSRGEARGIRGKRAAAYLTVEAALLLPMALLFIVLMIFLAFYSYDRCILEQSAYEAALRGTGSGIDSAEAAYDASAEAAMQLVRDRLFAVREVEYQVSVTPDAVIVTYRCEVNVPLIAWLGKYVEALDFSFEAHGEARRIRPVRTIRGCRIINGLIPE
ncbi:MAG: pilus assembly protein [Roseburia sp.]|nr:pilus assembly protein [Roseburia sp.]